MRIQLLNAVIGSLAGLAVLAGLPAQAAGTGEEEWARAEHFRVRLISTGDKLPPDGKIKAGLLFELAPGWHTYWKNPGDSGKAPAFDWSGSQNFKSAELSWPLPERFESFGLYTFGYQQDALFPVVLTATDPAKPLTVKAAVDIMICNDICIPERIDLTHVFQPGEPGRTFEAPRLQKAFADLPEQKDIPSLRLETAVAGPDALVVTAWAQNGFDMTDVFVEAGPDMPLSHPPEIILNEGDLRTATLKITAPVSVENLPQALSGRDIHVTLVNRGRAIEKKFSF